MTEIEVVWKTKPQSGITQIDIANLGCKNKAEWDALSSDERKKRINSYLEDSDGGNLAALVQEWYWSEE